MSDYVGKGSNGRYKAYQGRNNLWWKVVNKEGGFKPTFYLNNLSEDEALTIESYLINEIGYDNLTNKKSKNYIKILNIQEVEHEKDTISKEYILEESAEDKKVKRVPISDYTFLDAYFEKDENSVITTAEVKNITKLILDKHTNELAARGIFSPVPSSKVALYFGLKKPRNKRVKGKSVQVVEGLKIKNV